MRLYGRLLITSVEYCSRKEGQCFIWCRSKKQEREKQKVKKTKKKKDDKKEDKVG